MSFPALFSVVAGEDAGPVPIRFIPRTNITGMTFEFRATGFKNGLTIVKDNAAVGGLAVADAVNGVLNLSLSRADTLNQAADDFHFSVRRTDAGNNREYASGIFYLLPAQPGA